MMADGTLTNTAVPGIYMVQKLTDLPFQIVIGNELKGDENAEVGLLTDHANEKDVEILAEQLRSAGNTDTTVRENGQKLLEFVESKNPGITRKVLGGDEDMASILMDVLKPEIDEKIDNTTRTNLYIYDRAAKRAGMSITDFSNAMTRAGYTAPQNTSR